MTFTPKLVSEREPDGSWEDCTWASGVMLANFMEGSDVHPATRTEYESLREAGTGSREVDGKGSNNSELLAGMTRRYRLDPALVSGSWSSVLAAWPVGYGAAIQGKYSALPDRLRVTTFTGGHEVFAIRTSSTGFRMLDPLKAAGGSASSITATELGRFHTALPGATLLLGGEGEAQWRDPMFRIGLERWTVHPTAKVYEAPDARSAAVSGYAGQSDPYEITTLGVPLDRSADHTDYGWRAVLITTTALDGKRAPKVGWIRRRDLVAAVQSDPAWDEAVVAALYDPKFRGATQVTVDATAEQIAAARTKALDDAAAAVTALKG